MTDRINREKGLKRLEKKLRTGKLTKDHINNRGYNKYLKLSGEVNISDYDKYEADSVWDGLKGYVTNTHLPRKKVIGQYSQLWLVEKAFYAEYIVMQSGTKNMFYQIFKCLRSFPKFIAKFGYDFLLLFAFSS